MGGRIWEGTEEEEKDCCITTRAFTNGGTRPMYHFVLFCMWGKKERGSLSRDTVISAAGQCCFSGDLVYYLAWLLRESKRCITKRGTGRALTGGLHQQLSRYLNKLKNGINNRIIPLCSTTLCCSSVLSTNSHSPSVKREPGQTVCPLVALSILTLLWWYGAFFNCRYGMRSFSVLVCFAASPTGRANELPRVAGRGLHRTH